MKRRLLPTKVTKLFRRLHFFETVVSLFAFWWFLVLIFINPGVCNTLSVYRILIKLADANVWGTISGVVWAAQFFGMLWGNKRFRRVGHLLGVGYWTTIATTMAIAEVGGTGVGIYFLIAVMCAYLYWKVGEQQ